MKFIHTADWHLGNSMHDISRSEESIAFLKFLKECIIEQKASALIVAGDIFDTANPSNEAREQFYVFLASLLHTCCKNIVIVGGNHDSGSMLDAPKELLKVLNIHVVGDLVKKSIESLVFEMKDAKGSAIGICAAVPFVREPELRNFLTDNESSFAESAYRGLYKKVYEEANKLCNERSIPLIATGHLYAAGLEGRNANECSESMKNSGVRDIVGNLGIVPVSVFSSGFDYVALGHIHYASTVSKNEKVRYSGSPFVLGFDECRMPHYILSVEVTPNTMPIVQKIQTPKYFNFVRIEGNVDAIKQQLQKLKTMADSKTKVEIVYDYKPGLNIREELIHELENAPFEIVSWKTSRSEILAASDFSNDNIESIDVLGDEEIFRRLIMKNLGTREVTKDVENEFNAYWELFKQLSEEASASV